MMYFRLIVLVYYVLFAFDTNSVSVLIYITKVAAILLIGTFC